MSEKPPQEKFVDGVGIDYDEMYKEMIQNPAADVPVRTRRFTKSEQNARKSFLGKALGGKSPKVPKPPPPPPLGPGVPPTLATLGPQIAWDARWTPGLGQNLARP